MTTPVRSPLGTLLRTLPLALVLVVGVNACSPDSPSGPPAAAPAPRALLGLDPLITTSTSTLTNVTSGVPLVGGTVATVGAVVDGLLTCDSQSQTSVSKLIGPSGGSIQVGNHLLVVPQGALPSTIRITATRLSGSIAEVDFQPHGLRFAKPAALRLSYSHCDVPPNAQQSVVYLDDSNKIVEAPPSLDDANADQVTGWINHFSGYAVATRSME